MTETLMTEQDFAEQLRSEYRAQKFQELDPRSVARSLGGKYVPDLVFKRGDEIHVIEIKSAASQQAPRQIREWRRLVEKHPAWKFRFLVTPTRVATPVLDKESLADRFASASELAGTDPSLAIAQLWIVIEICLRELMRRHHEQTDLTVEGMEMARSLRTLGELDDDDLRLLEKGFQARNLAVHGFQIPRVEAIPPGLVDLARVLCEKVGIDLSKSRGLLARGSTSFEPYGVAVSGATVFGAVDRLLVEAVPERKEEIANLWLRYKPTFAITDERKGFTFQAEPEGSIFFNLRTLHQIWLLGFASWRALEAYSPALLVSQLSGEPLDLSEIARLPSQAEADAVFQRTLASAREFGESDELASFQWPSDVPRPNRFEFAIPSQKAAFDLICLAIAYAFLHELRHVVLATSKGPLKTLPEEELECDRFAREFMFERIVVYCQKSGYAKELVLAKRAMGVALLDFVILEVTPVDLKQSVRTHPGVSARLKALIDDVQLDEKSHFWVYLTSLLIAYLRETKHIPTRLAATNPKDLCHELVRLVPWYA